MSASLDALTSVIHAAEGIIDAAEELLAHPAVTTAAASDSDLEALTVELQQHVTNYNNAQSSLASAVAAAPASAPAPVTTPTS